VARDLFDTVPARALARKSGRPAGPAVLEELEHEREVLARIIIRYGEGAEKFLPIFQRLDRECAAARQQDDVIGRVRRLANATAA
jgi:hypothetical protein